MTETEVLQSQITGLLSELKELGEDSGLNLFDEAEVRDRYKEENSRIEKYLSEFSNRQGILLAVGGLLTLIPVLEKEEIRHYLIWVFPFLFVGILAYIFSSKRINFVSRRKPVLLKYKEINKLLKEVYFRSMFFHKITDISLVIFFIVFILNSYLNYFFEKATLNQNILVLGVGASFGAIRFWYIRKNYNEDRHAIGSGNDDVPVYEGVPMHAPGTGDNK